MLVLNTIVLCSDFCAVRVILKDKNGKSASALVELRNAAGEVVQHSTADDGVAEFCDFEFGEYSIKIGGTTCAELIIPQVRVSFGLTHVYWAYVNECAGWDVSLEGACRIYIRASSSTGEKLPGVSVALSQPSEIKAFTDSYGRALVNMTLGKSSVLVFSKSGYISQSQALTCASPGIAERKIIMDPVPR